MKLPKSVYNWTSVIGLTIAIIALFMIGFLFTISFFFNQGSSYLGILMYMVIPVFFLFGLVLIPIGMWLQNRKSKKIEKEGLKLNWPKIDFNDSRNRNAFLIFTIGSTIVLLLSAVGSYEAFHYSESVEFCGTLCHDVMEPEYVAYQNSPHARVKCVECHVGEGADWYVKSKMSGMYQLYAVTVKNYPTPIPSPVANLRPARETCEKCHWPEKFYARQHRLERHYLADEENTEWDISMQIKTGPSYSALGLQEGIHWHINPDVTIEYKSLDNREVIPWVRYTNSKTGEEYIYTDIENPADQQELDALEIRTMDCMDCHNRPSHSYLSPSKFVNNAMTANLISTSIPEIKMVAMDLLHVNYPTKDSALMAIEEGIREYYESSYPEFMDTSSLLIDEAITTLQEEFQKNIFPQMKVRWDAYPNHIGHIESNGCFRCHDNNHQSEQQRNIEKDCNLCHIINAQGNPANMDAALTFEFLEFKHPVDIGEEWKATNCSECHAGMY